MSDQVEKRWIIVRKPNQIPIVKTPVNSYEGVLEMTEELYKLYPNAELTVVELAYGQQLWVTDGKEVLERHKIYEEAENES